MDTIKVNRGNVKMVAHRGVSGLELENTCAAFVAAGNRSYFGIETDIHKTADGKYIVIHDDKTGRVAQENVVVEDSTYDQLRAIQLHEKDGSVRADLVMPDLQEYLSVCKRYGKVAVLELKNPFDKEAIAEVVAICKAQYGLENVVFISFFFQNMLYVKEAAPEANAQYLLYDNIDLLERTDLVEKMLSNGLDVDIYHEMLTKAHVDYLHSRGMKINCWTVDDPKRAEELPAWGVDYITTNILE